MITADDIKMLVASGEGYNAEFKASVPAKVKELSEEVCAFANAAGGVLLIGVNDQKKLPPPQFQKTGIFTVTLMRPEKSSGKSSGKSSVKVVALMKENKDITIPEIAENLGLTTRAIEKQIAKLKKQGLINRIGSEKGGFWQVNHNGK